MGEKKDKKKIGAQTKYTPKLCDKLIDFFDADPYYEKEIPHFNKNGGLAWTGYQLVANRLPTLRNFAKKYNIGRSTIYDWVNPEHASYQKDFSDTLEKAKIIRKWFLIENGLNGLYNSGFAIFTAKNVTDMTDKKELGGELTIISNILDEIESEE